MENNIYKQKIQLIQAIEDYLEPFKEDPTKAEKIEKLRQYFYDAFQLNPDNSTEPITNGRIDLEGYRQTKDGEILINVSNIEFRKKLVEIESVRETQFGGIGFKIDPNSILHKLMII